MQNHGIEEYPELGEIQKDHWIQVLALCRTAPRIPIHAWDHCPMQEFNVSFEETSYNNAYFYFEMSKAHIAKLGWPLPELLFFEPSLVATVAYRELVHMDFWPCLAWPWTCSAFRENQVSLVLEYQKEFWMLMTALQPAGDGGKCTWVFCFTPSHWAFQVKVNKTHLWFQLLQY